jgi:hypothetical protein
MRVSLGGRLPAGGTSVFEVRLPRAGWNTTRLISAGDPPGVVA